MSEEKRVPEVRFEGFEDEWKELSLSSLIHAIHGGASVAPGDYKDSGVPTVPKGAVNETGVADLSGSKYVSKDFFNKNINTSVNSKELVTSLRDLVPSAPNMGRIVKLDSTGKQYLMPQGVYKVLLKENVDESFLISTSNTDDFREVISKEKNGSTQVHIRNSQYMDIPINVPTYNEQQMMGRYFREIEDIISSKNKEIKHFKNIKQAMLQKMFPKEGERVPEVRFEGFEGEWEFKELGDVTSVNTGDSDLQDSVSDGKYPLFVRSDEVRRSNRYLFDGEAILIPGEGRLGEIFHYVNGKFDFHQRVYKISDFIGVDAKYIMYYMKRYFKRHALKNTAKATVDSLRRDVITKFEIQIPSINEQKRISNYFNTLEQNIQSKQSELDKLKQFKQAMLDKMFV